MKENIDKLNQKLSSCHITHYYGYIYQIFSIIPNLSYPLVLSSLSNKQLKSIHRIIHPSIIASKEFNQHWPEALRYGFHKFCSLKMIYYRVDQHLRKIQAIPKLLLHPKYQTSIQEITKWYQISVGTPCQILATPPNTWIISTLYISKICWIS